MTVKVNEEYSFSYELTKKCKILIKLQVYGYQVCWKHFILQYSSCYVSSCIFYLLCQGCFVVRQMNGTEKKPGKKIPCYFK